MQDMRQWIVMTLLDSERSFVLTLTTLLHVCRLCYHHHHRHQSS